METTTTLFDTPLATIQRTEPGLVEVRFKPGCILTVEGITNILDKRDQLGRSGPARILIVFPEEMDFDMSMISTDHYKGRPIQEHSLAIAWAVQNDRNERFTRMYFAYFPCPVASAIFYSEEEARSWLLLQ